MADSQLGDINQQVGPQFSVSAVELQETEPSVDLPSTQPNGELQSAPAMIELEVQHAQPIFEEQPVQSNDDLHSVIDLQPAQPIVDHGSTQTVDDPSQPVSELRSVVDPSTLECMEVKVESHNSSQIEQVLEPLRDPKIEVGEEGEVQVIYLNVSDTDESQVLDLSSLLAQQGIQVVDHTEIQAIDTKEEINDFQVQDIVIEQTDDDGNITMVAASQSETQSAHALLNLANAQTEGGSVQVSDILAAHRQVEEAVEKDASSATKALLQLAADQSSGTYIVDENGTMIPITDVRGDNILHVEDTGVTTIAICQCFCGREFISQEDLEKHKAMHKYEDHTRSAQSPGTGIEPNLQSCSLCDNQFDSIRELMQHHKEVHPGELPWQCDACGKRYHKKMALKAHMRVHNTMARYQCSTCKKVFFYKSAMTRHIKQHTCEKPFKCTICGEMLNTLWELRKHRVNHQVRSLFHCDICSKVFKQKATLVVHSRVHTGQRPYTCDICNKSFSLKSTLTQHRRIHTGEKPNVCPICNQRFRQASTMQSHMKRHTHDKPYICRYCRSRFAYQDELTEHELAHAHNKKWQCDECGMRFKNQSLLARHCRRHTNERPFVCEVCNKSFVQSGSLRAHMRSHTNEKPYYCRMCSKAYATSGTLLLHIRKIHNLAAKTVKEVFPVYKCIEDQKVFTIRNKPLVGSETVINNENVSVNEERVTVVLEESMSATESQADQQVTTGELDSAELKESLKQLRSDQDTVVITNGSSDNIIQLEAEAEVNNTDETYNVDQAETLVPVSESGDSAVTSLTQLGEVWGAAEDGSHPVQVAAEVDVSSHSLHSAQDRQEAALGLAELSLFGAGGSSTTSATSATVAVTSSAISGETTLTQLQPAVVPSTQQRTKTFFKEEEEDENDPNITKIILSKEGGVMNSQDPHQCPICHRIFGRKSIMVEHLRIHTDEKPYECDFCNAGFRQNAQLRSHIRNRHTRIERYQCSFCHNRFLSRSIAIRHIKFHHKLKMKFCLESNPLWTVESAVWCDDKFEFNIEDPQFLKVSRKSKAAIKKSKRDLALQATEKTVTMGLSSLSQKKFVVNVSNTREICVTNVTDGEIDDLKEVKASNTVSSSARTDGTLTYTVGEEFDKAGSADDYMDSQLLCGTCKMQFDSMSSLRTHLHIVHQTTLAESDVSVVYEDADQSEAATAAASVNTDSSYMQQVEQLKHDHDGLESSKEVTTIPEKRTASSIKGRNVTILGDECLNACRMCSEGFFYRDDLDQHMRSHTEEEVERVGMHRCDTCCLVLKNTQEVAKHIQRCHGVARIYCCSICDKEFFQESSVYRHMKFFHKWEIKIRGEVNIPVIVKPAPKALHKPAMTSTSGSYSIPRTRVERRKMNRSGSSRISLDSATSSSEIDRILQGDVGTKVVKKEVAESPEVIVIEHQGKSNAVSAISSSTETANESQAPSYIIVRDGSLIEDGDTQKFVEKLISFFQSKSRETGEPSKRQPKVVKITSVGSASEKINTVTELDVNEALAEISGVKVEISPGQTSALVENVQDEGEVCYEAPAEGVDESNDLQNESDDKKSTAMKGHISVLGSKEDDVSVRDNQEGETNDKSSACEYETLAEASRGDINFTPSDQEENVITIQVEPSADNLAFDEVNERSESQNAKKNVSRKSPKSSPLKQHMKYTIKVGQTTSSVSEDVPSESMISSDAKSDCVVGAPSFTSQVASSSKASSLDISEQKPNVKNLSRVSPKKTKAISVLQDISKSNETSTMSIKKELRGKISKVVLEPLKAEEIHPPIHLDSTKGRVSNSVSKTNKQALSKQGKSDSSKPSKSSQGHKTIKQEPVPERRSSSGRLIKRKTFGDDIEDMSPIGKRKK